MTNKRTLKLIIAGTFLAGVLIGTYVNISKTNEKVNAETIILENLNSNEPKQNSLSINTKNDSASSELTNIFTDSNNLNEEHIEYTRAIGWSSNDKLLFFKSTSNYLEGDKIISKIILEERTENGEVFKNHEIKFEMDKYNENLISDYYIYESSFIDNVKYIVSLSPDREKVLVSAEIINAENISNDQYRITNKGYSAVCNLRTDEVTLIDDNSRFVRWSSDSKNVFGINYAACYYKYQESPYDQHFFPAYTYRNISYNIEDKKVDVITEDKDLYESLTVTKDTYDNILNTTNLKEKKRFLIGFIDSEVVKNPKFDIKKITFNNNPYNLNHILDITEKGQYTFIGTDNLEEDSNGFPAIYVTDKENGQNKKVFETFISNTQKILIHDGNLLYDGITESSQNSRENVDNGLCILNLDSSENKLLYEGNASLFTYSPKSKMIAIYDDWKKNIFVGKLVNNKLIDLKSYYKMKLRAFEMYFNEDGTKLYFKGSSKDISGVINLSSGEVTEILERK